MLPLHNQDIRRLYDRFDAPVTALDCGKQCAPHNPNGKPFCCDICQAVPSVYQAEWSYLQINTELWQPWRGDECASEVILPDDLRAETPATMQLLACKGPSHCQREYRALSCRQFPFFPYITSHDRFIGLAYDWEFEETCWVISHLELVSPTFQHEFVQVFDEIFAQSEEEFDGYAVLSEEIRLHYIKQKRRFTILHREGGYRLVSPGSERLEKVNQVRLRRFGIYDFYTG